jgi:hypothetical protein
MLEDAPRVWESAPGVHKKEQIVHCASVGSRVGYKKSLSLLAETIFRCDTGFHFVAGHH